MSSKSLDEVMDLLIPPQPPREAVECGLSFRFRAPTSTNMAIDYFSVGPVSFNCHDIEPVPFYEMLRDFGTGFVEFMRSMSCGADEYNFVSSETLTNYRYLVNVRIIVFYLS
jgi:hypothetical protein